MSGLLDISVGAINFIINAVNSFVDFVIDIFTEGPWNAFKNLLGDLWSNFVDNILEPIFAFFGITDEDYYETQVVACKIYDEDLLQKMKVQNIIEYVTQGLSVTAYLKLFADVGDAQFNSYYRYGQWYYLDYLPTTQITSVSIDSALITDVLEQLRGEDIYILKISVVGVSANTWCKYYLQENYDYDVGEDFVILDGTYYYFNNTAYDENTATYIVTLSEIPQITVRVYEIVTTQVTNETITLNTTTTTYTTTTLYLNINITTQTGIYTRMWTESDGSDGVFYLYTETSTLTQKLTNDGIAVSAEYTNIETTVSEIAYSQEETYTFNIETTEESVESWVYIYSYDQVQVTGGATETYITNETGVWEVYTDQTEGSTVSNPVTINNGTYYIANVTTETSTRYYRSDTGSYLTSVSTSETTTSYVTSGAGSTSTNTTLIEVYTITNDNPGTYTVSVPYFNASQRMYQVLYSVPSTGRQYYWIYDPSTGDVADLNDPVTSTQDLEVYPICTLRMLNKDISDWETANVEQLTEERYESATTLMNKIGLDVDAVIDAYSENESIEYVTSAFFLLAVSPSNTAEVVSKALYNLFEFIYKIMPYPTEISLSDNAAMSMSVKEEPFHATTIWFPIPESEQEEVIGSLGYCTHEIRNNAITTTTYEVTILVDNGDGTLTKTTYTEEASEDLYGTPLGSITSDYKTVTQNGIGVPGTYKEVISTKTTTGNKDLVVKKQVTATTTNTITVFSMITANLITAEEGYFGVSLDADNENMLIPLPVKVVESLSILEKTALLGEACYLLFYAVQHVHLEWYQTDAFASFMQVFQIAIIVIAAVLSIWTGGQSLTLASAAIAVLKAATIAVGTSLALQLISELVSDTTLKVILSMAVMIVAFWAGGGFDAIFEEFDFTKAVNLVTMPVKAIQIVTNDLMSALQSEYEDFTEKYEARLEEYEEAFDEINDGLSTEFLADLIVSGGMHSNSATNSIVSSIVYSPSAFYFMTFDYYRDFDTLYDGLYDTYVGSFVSNKLKIGIVGDSATGVDDDE